MRSKGTLGWDIGLEHTFEDVPPWLNNIITKGLENHKVALVALLLAIGFLVLLYVKYFLWWF